MIRKLRLERDGVFWDLYVGDGHVAFGVDVTLEKGSNLRPNRIIIEVGDTLMDEVSRELGVETTAREP